MISDLLKRTLHKLTVPFRRAFVVPGAEDEKNQPMVFIGLSIRRAHCKLRNLI